MAGVLTEETLPSTETIELFVGDLDSPSFQHARRSTVLSWDIETTGLDWRTERIGTVQLKTGNATYIVQVNGETPTRLKALLEDPGPLKVIHHAMFDLRFMASHWDAVPAHVGCTKIAAKLAHRDARPAEHSLEALIRRYFGIHLDKGQRLSDWTAPELAGDQLRYAAQDVRYLWPLYLALESELRQRGLVDLRDRCFEHLPTRVALELGGFPDVFDY